MVGFFENDPNSSGRPCFGASGFSPAMTTGNAEPILHEIRHAVARLLENGEATVIDLRAMPFGPGDEQRFEEVIGEGAVAATVEELVKIDLT